MLKKHLLFWTIVVAGLAYLANDILRIGRTAAARDRRAAPQALPVRSSEESLLISSIDADFRAEWSAENLSPAARASDLLVLRRLSLGLMGVIPSLEEIRAFERLPADERIERSVERILADRRFADNFAERLARAYVGTEDGPFLIFRRRRFVTWLSDQILANRPYDAIVRDLISDNGLWTDHPAVNFITAAYDQDKKRPDADRLAARTARAFLGSRIDCAQCHDHPFQKWKQADFQGIAAYFGQAESGFAGIQDGKGTYDPINRKTGKPEVVEPKVPFHPELVPQGDRALRKRLAAWVTDPRNESFSQATVNRIWMILFGRPLVSPVDDLAAASEIPRPLKRLAEDFRTHGHDLHRLLRMIAATEVFRGESAAPADASEEAAELAWAAYPVSMLRSEQIVRSLIQACTIETIDANSHILTRLFAQGAERDFTVRYGDPAEDTPADCATTIPRRLLLMNGKIVTERTKAELLSAAGQIAADAPSDLEAVRVAYLSALTREPTREEADYFTPRLKQARGETRKKIVSDLFWTLINSTEFSWGH